MNQNDFVYDKIAGSLAKFSNDENRSCPYSEFENAVKIMDIPNKNVFKTPQEANCKDFDETSKCPNTLGNKNFLG